MLVGERRGVDGGWMWNVCAEADAIALGHWEKFKGRFFAQAPSRAAHNLEAQEQATFG